MAAIVRSVMVRCLCIVCLTILAVCARADPDATLPLSNDAAIVLKKAATLNEIARALYPNNREARDDYRERLARANPQVFTKAGQVRSVTLPAGTRLQIPAGTLIPPAQFVAAVEALRAPVASAAVAPNSGAVQPSAPQSGAGPPAGGEVNALTRSLVEYGVLNCAARINQVTNFIGFSPQAGAVIMIPGSSVDQRLLPLAMEIPTPGGPACVAASFAPNQVNGCGAAYDAVAYWPINCESLASRQFQDLKRVGALKKDITVLDGGANLKVLLMPAGSGCVSIKKENTP